MTREKLPARRHCETRDYQREGVNFTVSYGRNDEGQIKEVFVNAAKEGAALSILLADTATILSIALQRGSTPSELIKSIRREPNNRPSSAIGFIITQMAKANKDIPEDVRESA